MSQTAIPGAVNAKRSSGTPIDIQDMSIEYQSGSKTVRALEPISMHIKAGEFVSVVGRGRVQLGRSAVLGADWRSGT